MRRPASAAERSGARPTPSPRAPQICQRLQRAEKEPTPAFEGNPFSEPSKYALYFLFRTRKIFRAQIAMTGDADNQQSFQACGLRTRNVHYLTGKESVTKHLFDLRDGGTVKSELTQLREIVQNRDFETIIVHLFADVRQVDCAGLIELAGQQVSVREIGLNPGLFVVQQQRGSRGSDGLLKMIAEQLGPAQRAVSESRAIDR